MWEFIIALVILVIAAVMFGMAGAKKNFGAVVTGMVAMAIGTYLLWLSFAGMVSTPVRLSSRSVYRLLAQVEVPGPDWKRHRLIVVQDRKDENAVYCVYNKQGVVLPEGTTFVERADTDDAVRPASLAEKPAK